jgi:hypothetical protein
LCNWREIASAKPAYISQGWGRSVMPTVKSPPAISMLAF